MSTKANHPMRSAIQHTPALARIAAGIALVASVTACGYKGPLYLPEPTEVSPAPPGTVTQPAANEAPIDDVPEAAPRIQ